MSREYLSNTEYHAVRHLFALASGTEACAELLKKRMREYAAPRTWARFRQAAALFDKALQNVLDTIEPRKLAHIQQELQHVVLELKVTGPVGRKEGEWCYISSDDLNALITQVGEDNCYLCDKCGADAKRCPIRKMFERSVPWSVKTMEKDGTCCFSGMWGAGNAVNQNETEWGENDE